MNLIGLYASNSDEFLIGCPEGFLSAFDDTTDQILLNWVTFGSSGHRLPPSGLVIRNFLYRTAEINGINRHTKAFVRPDKILSCPNPHYFHVKGRSVDIDDVDIVWSSNPGPGVIAGPPKLDGPRIHHYWTKSAADWSKKNTRGYPGQPNFRPRGAAELATFDKVAAVHDESAVPYADKVQNVLTGLGLSVDAEPREEPLAGRALLTNCRLSGGNHGFEGVVMDIGVSEGSDTAFYLAKGFRVVAVEADPGMCQSLRNRFAREIETGALTLLNFVASATFGNTVKFHVHDRVQGISSVYKRPDVDPSGYSEHLVMTIDWRTLRTQAGTPRYVKVDIGGLEERFLAGMVGEKQLPEFISIEAYKFRPCEMLHEMGYERFMLIDQKAPGGFQLPAVQFEGQHVASADFTHASGPFGLDLFTNGKWSDFGQFRVLWQTCQPKMAFTWFDCHAWKPN